MSKMNELAGELKMLKSRKAELETMEKENSAKIDEVEKQLYSLMESEGNESFEYDGTKFSLNKKTIFSVPSDLRDAFLDVLKTYGFDREDIVTETIPAPKLNSVMKSITDENRGMPEEFEGIVSLYDKKTVSVRKSTKKRVI